MITTLLENTVPDIVPPLVTRGKHQSNQPTQTCAITRPDGDLGRKPGKARCAQNTKTQDAGTIPRGHYEYAAFRSLFRYLAHDKPTTCALPCIFLVGRNDGISSASSLAFPGWRPEGTDETAVGFSESIGGTAPGRLNIACEQGFV